MTKFKKRKGENPLTLTDTQNNDKTNKPSTSKSANSENSSRSLAFVPDKFTKIFRKNKKKKASEETNDNKLLNGNYIIQNRHASPLLSNENTDESSDEISAAFSPTNHVGIKDNEINRNFIEAILNVHEKKILTKSLKRKRKDVCPIKNKRVRTENSMSFNDAESWEKVKTCCGDIFDNKMSNAVLVNNDFYYVCAQHKKTVKANNAITTKISSSASTATQLLNNEKENLNGYNSIIDNLILPPTIAPSSTIVKKHHLFSKRQNQHICEHGNDQYKTDTVTTSDVSKMVPIIFTTQKVQQSDVNIQTPSISVITSQQSQLLLPPPPQQSMQYNQLQQQIQQTLSSKIITTGTPSSSNAKYQTISTQYLHKIKDSGKIVKQISTMDKTSIPAKLRATDFTLVKNLVKICTDKSKAKNAIINTTGGTILIGNVAGSSSGSDNKINGPNENLADGLGNKFSDNSSDSGYEETPVEQQQVNVSLLLICLCVI